jgi:two-component system cell cycle sensor histidine kinase/response regulator CckA
VPRLGASPLARGPIAAAGGGPSAGTRAVLIGTISIPPVSLRLSAEERWALVAAAVAVAIGILDFVAAPKMIVLNLLAVPPLIAAARTRPDTTAWIGLLALALALGLGAHERTWLSHDHVLRMLAVGASAGLAVGLAWERARAEQSLGAAYRISQAAQTAPTLQDLYGAIHTIVGELMPARNFYIALYDAATDTISFPYFVDEYDETPAPKQPGTGLTEYVLRSGQGLLATPEVARELERRREVELIGAPSIDWLGVPLQTAGHTIGVLVVQSYTERVRYSERQKRALQFVSTQVAMAIERKRAEEALREGEERFRALSSATVEAIALHESGRIIEVNGAFLRMFGYDDPKEVLGRSVHEFGSPQTRDRVAEAIASGLESPYEAVGLRRDGTTFFAELTGKTAGYRGRQVRVTAIRDITASRQAEEALRESEERYRRLVELAPDAIVVHSGGRIVFVNAAGARLVGAASAEQLVGRDLLEFVHPESRPAVVERMRVMLEQGKAVPRISERFVRLDGSAVEVDVLATPLRYHDAPAVLVVARDISERLRREEAQRVLEEQLRQAQKMEAVGQLAGGIAHDFNNLLTTILTMCQMLESELAADTPAQGDLAAIRGAAQHGSELTRKLLAFSRHQRLQLRPVPVGTLVSEFLRMARRVVPEDVEVRAEVEAPDALVTADPAALEQILTNLVTNARDSMPGGGKLTIGVARAVVNAESARTLGGGRPGEYAVLSVSDTGVGMDTETRRRMFEPFFTTKPVGQGTGLGMPMVYGLVKDHGGFVEVESAVGRGTTVRVYVPAGARAPEARAAAAAELRGGSETILLVEDDEALRRAGMRVLRKYGYTVITASNGVEALNIMRRGETTPDLIVSDVVMPHTSGPQFLQALRDAGVSPRILFTSGYTARDVHDRMPLEPDVPFLAKPWSITDLLRRVREILDAPARA